MEGDGLHRRGRGERGCAAEDLQQGSAEWQALVDAFAQFVNETQGQVDEIIIPTGQLFIEALPGSHPLLEDFMLLHRAEDVRKVKAEVRHAELENLRLASRLAAAQRTPRISTCSRTRTLTRRCSSRAAPAW